MDLFNQLYLQIGSNCEMSVPSEVFWGNIPFMHCKLVAAEKSQVFLTKVVNLQNTKVIKTDKHRRHQDC